MPLDFPDVMGFEIPDDEWGHDDDALLADDDVDAMAAARRSAPPAQPPPALVEARFAPNPAAPRANHHPHHHPAHPRPDPPPPPVGTTGFSGRAGGFSGAGRHPQQQQNRWRTGHDAVDRATASGAPRGAVHDAPDADQRTLSFAPAPASRRRAPRGAPDDRQRTLVGMFANHPPAANQPPAPPSTRAHEEALDDDDWNVHAWDSRPAAPISAHLVPRARDAPGPSPAPAPPPPAPPAGGGGYGYGYGYTTPRWGGVHPPEAIGTPNSAGLVRSSTATAGMLLDPAAAQTYQYPAQMARREYQYEMTRRALLTNSLVCLPTGLGKTLIAAVVMLNYHRWFPDGLVVFLAPTRPLVDQQRAACRDICGIPSDATCVLMGSTRKDADGTRRSLWRAKRVFFCTPQTMQNDIRDGVCDASKVVCVVVDEAHRAKGNHAYCQVVEQLWRRGTSFRLLALSATPGHDVKEVQGVVESLRIGRIDFRSDKDPDVKKYTHAREIRLEKVTETRAMDRVKDMLRDVVRPILRKLVAIGAFPNEGYKMRAFVEGSSKEFPQPFTIQMAIKDMNGQGPQGQAANMNPAQRGMAYQQSQQAWFVCRVAHLMQTNSPRVAVDYVGKEEASRVYVAGLNQNPVFREAMDHLKSMAGQGAHHSPKLGRLTQIVRRHFSNNDPDSRVIVFTSYRDSVNDIVRALGEVTLADGPLAPDRPAVAPEKGQGTITGAFAANRSNERAPTPPGGAAANDSSSGFLGAYAGVGHLPGVGEVVTGAECRIKVAQFIGQGDTTKGGARGAGAERGTRGQTQREQKEVLDAFRRGHINTIVATSIGEEGLDIPSVDLIVFFDVVDIIRTIQRMGRTGRARDGRVVVLAVEGLEAEKFKREQGRYDHMVKSLHDPGRCFNLCNDCPRMLPEGLHPRCDLKALGPTPEKLKLAAEQKLPGRHPAARGGSSASEKSRLRTRRRDGVVHSRPWDAPLTIVETTLLRAYDVDPEMVRRFDPHGAASLQRRPTSVYAAPHGDASRLMMRVMSAAQGLPPPADEDGAVIPGGAMWRAQTRRAEEDEAAKKNAGGIRGYPKNIVNTSPEAPTSASREAAGDCAAEAEEESRDDDVFDDARRRDSFSFGEKDDADWCGTPAEAYYAPPAEWDGDRWDPGKEEEKER